MTDQKQPKVTLQIEEVQFALGPYLACQVQVEGEPGGPVPTGVVDFRRNGTVMGNCVLDADGRGYLKYSGFPAGKSLIVSGYSGDRNYMPLESEAIPYVPSKPTKMAVPQKMPPGFTHIPAGSQSPQVRVTENKRETVFEVNLSAYSIPTPLASGRTNLDSLTATRRINIAGVGSGLKHGDKFSLIGEEAKKVYRGYKEFLIIVSGGWNET